VCDERLCVYAAARVVRCDERMNCGYARRMTLTEIHAVLREALDAVGGLHRRLPDETSTDTAFAIGEAFGVLSRALELVGRDIDDAKDDPQA
jgi:hypothetical protein